MSARPDPNRRYRAVVGIEERLLTKSRRYLLLHLECGHSQRKRGAAMVVPYRHRCYHCELAARVGA